MNIEGKVGNVYYTKTGYLIKDNLVSNIELNGETYSIDTTNEDTIKEKILGTRNSAHDELSINAAGNAKVTFSNVDISVDWKNEIVTPLSNLGAYQDDKR